MGQNFASLAYGKCRDVPRVLNVLFMRKVNFRKNPVLPVEKFASLVLPRNAIWLQHLIIRFTLHYLRSGRLLEVKKQKKISNF